jgi:hypothetical protein
MSYRSRSYPPGPSCENNEGQWAGAIKRAQKSVEGTLYIGALPLLQEPVGAALGRRSAFGDGLAISEGHQLAFTWKESERANRRGCWDCRDALPADEAEG